MQQPIIREALIHKLTRIAAAYEMSAHTMLNHILTVALDELDGRQDDYTVCLPVARTPAPGHAGDGLIVTEGVFDVMELWQRGRKNAVSILGSSMSEAQEQLIVDTVGPRGRVLLALDQDEAGYSGMADAAARLAPQVFVRTMGRMA